MNKHLKNAIPKTICSLELRDQFSMKKESDKVLFYHGECIDGAASLWVFANKYKNEMKYVPLLHVDDDVIEKQILDHVNENSEIIFADFAPPVNVMKNILAKIENGKGKIKVIDHHETAINDYAELPAHKQLELVFDKERAGGRLVYDEIHNNGEKTPEKDLPNIIKVAEMLDLNQKDKKNFKEISSYVDDFELNTAHRAYLVARMIQGMPIKKIIERGTLKYNQEITKIDKLFKSQAKIISINIPEVSEDPLSAVIVPARLKNFSRHFDNELIRYTQEQYADLGMSYYNDDGLIRVSIRRPDDVIDLSVVGEALKKQGKGGGGRAAAAAARFNPSQFSKVFGFSPEGYCNIAQRKKDSRFVFSCGDLVAGIEERKSQKSNPKRYEALEKTIKARDEAIKAAKLEALAKKLLKSKYPSISEILFEQKMGGNQNTG